MVLWFRRQARIEERLQAYFARCDECLAAFEKALAVYFGVGLGEPFDAAVGATHRAESAADDLRREIERTLYEKALLPDSRGDLLGLLESFDQLPNAAETVLFSIQSQALVLPEGFVDPFRVLCDTNVEAYRRVRSLVDLLLQRPRLVQASVAEVGAKESESDRIEREIIRKLFATGLETGDKLLYKDLVLLIGKISDRAENTADRIGIVAIKRQV